MKIIVFGSNLSGHHGKGAALYAKEHYGARQHNPSGFQGQSYAIPTKGARNEALREKYPILPLPVIAASIRVMLDEARQSPYDTYAITRIGCGLAGYKNEQIAPMFEGAPNNCEFDPEWAPWGLKSWVEKP
jgi:hypothetical protein